MTVKVNQEKWVSANMRLDNHGPETTSENRAYADFYLHNPMGWGDELYVALLNTYDPDSSTYGSLRYNSFVLSPRWRSSLGFSTNEFFSRNLRQEGAPTIEGESDVIDASLTYHFKRSRVKNFSVGLKYMNIDTLTESFSVPSTEVVKKTSLSFNFDVLNQKRRHLYVGDVSLHSASVEERGGFSEGDSDDYFVTTNFTVLSFFRIPWTQYDTRFLTKAALQYSGKPLSNLNQVTLAGANRARAFGPNAFQADDGVYLGVDWIFAMPQFGGATLFGDPIKDVIQPYLFADASWGEVHPLNDGEEGITGNLSNIGAGLKLSFKNVSGSVSGSKVTTLDIDGLQGESEEKKFIFELQYKF